MHYFSLIWIAVQSLCENSSPELIHDPYTRQLVSRRQIILQAGALSELLERFLPPPSSTLPLLVGLHVEQSVTYILLVLAVLATGAAFVPLDRAWPLSRVAQVCRQAGVTVVITDLARKPVNQVAEGNISSDASENFCFTHEHSQSGWQALEELLASGLEGAQGTGTQHVQPLLVAVSDLLPISGVGIHSTVPIASRVNISVKTPKDAVPLPFCYVLFTSGSTGSPLGVCGTEAGILNRCRWMQDTYPLTQSDVICFKTSISFVDHIWELFATLLGPGSLVILPPSLALRPDELAAQLVQWRVTHLVSVPSILHLLHPALKSVEARLAMRVLVSSGEQLTWDLAHKLLDCLPSDCHLLNLYGSTEVSADATCLNVREALEKASLDCQPIAGGVSVSDEYRLVPAGYPIAGMSVYVVDVPEDKVLESDGDAADQQLCRCVVFQSPPGKVGEVWVAGPGLALSYLNDERTTAARFVEIKAVGDAARASSDLPHALLPAGRYFRTGDLGYKTDAGSLTVLGRRSGFVKVRGARVDVGEVERVLGHHPALREAAVTVREQVLGSGSAGLELLAWCVMHDKAQLGDQRVRDSEQQVASDIRNWLLARLPSAAVPSRFTFLDSLPRTPAGKVLRSALALPSAAVHAAGAHQGSLSTQQLVTVEAIPDLEDTPGRRHDLAGNDSIQKLQPTANSASGNDQRASTSQGRSNESGSERLDNTLRLSKRARTSAVSTYPPVRKAWVAPLMAGDNFTHDLRTQSGQYASTSEPSYTKSHQVTLVNDMHEPAPQPSNLPPLTEARLLPLMARASGCPALEPAQDFFTAGGTSLAAAALAAALGIDVRLLFAYPSAHTLADALAEQIDPADLSHDSRQVSGQYASTAAQDNTKSHQILPSSEGPEVAPQPPKNPPLTEARLLPLMAGAADCPALEPAQDFFTAGGTSLAAAALAAALGIDVRLLFAYPSARSLAAALAKEDSGYEEIRAVPLADQEEGGRVASSNQRARAVVGQGTKDGPNHGQSLHTEERKLHSGITSYTCVAPKLLQLPAAAELLQLPATSELFQLPAALIQEVPSLVSISHGGKYHSWGLIASYTANTTPAPANIAVPDGVSTEEIPALSRTKFAQELFGTTLPSCPYASHVVTRVTEVALTPSTQVKTRASELVLGGQGLSELQSRSTSALQDYIVNEANQLSGARVLWKKKMQACVDAPPLLIVHLESRVQTPRPDKGMELIGGSSGNCAKEPEGASVGAVLTLNSTDETQLDCSVGAEAEAAATAASAATAAAATATAAAAAAVTAAAVPAAAAAVKATPAAAVAVAVEVPHMVEDDSPQQVMQPPLLESQDRPSMTFVDTAADDHSHKHMQSMLPHEYNDPKLSAQACAVGSTSAEIRTLCRVVCMSHGGDVACLNVEDGTTIWEAQLPGHADVGPALSGCGRYVLVPASERVHSLDLEHGEMCGVVEAGGEVRAPPLTDSLRDVAWIASHAPALLAVRAPDQILLRFELESPVSAGLALSHCPPLLLVATLKGSLLAYNIPAWFHDHNGDVGTCAPAQPQWVLEYSAPIFSTPVVHEPTSRALSVSVDGTLKAASLVDGTLQWSTQVPRHVFADLVLLPGAWNGVLVASQAGLLVCLDCASGTQLWRVDLAGVVPNVPAPSLSTLGLLGFYGDNASKFNGATSSLSKLQLLCSCTNGAALMLEVSPTTQHLSGVQSPSSSALGTLSGTSHCPSAKDATVATREARRLPADSFSSPIHFNGRIFVGCRDDFFYCLETNECI